MKLAIEGVIVNRQKAVTTTGSEARAMQAAAALGQTLGRSPAFRKFEAAQEALMTTDGLRNRLEACQRRQDALQKARAWGGADPAAQQELDAEWQRLLAMPEVRAYQEAQEELVELCAKIVSEISAGVNLDFSRACAPSGGCC